MIRQLKLKLYSDSLSNLLIEISNYLLSENNFGSSSISCLNPHSYFLTKENIKFYCSLINSKWLLCDGIGVSLFFNNVHRITGYNIFMELSNLLNNEVLLPKRIFFLGASIDCLNVIQNKFSKDFPNLVICGIYSPPYKNSFDNSDLDIMIDLINDSKAEILFVGMGAPKQEIIFEEIKESLKYVKLSLSIGAVFDYYSGFSKRSDVISKLGFEWVFRFIQNPFKLWERTLISMPIFIFDVLIESISVKTNKRD